MVVILYDTNIHKRGALYKDAGKYKEIKMYVFLY